MLISSIFYDLNDKKEKPSTKYDDNSFLEIFQQATNETTIYPNTHPQTPSKGGELFSNREIDNLTISHQIDNKIENDNPSNQLSIDENSDLDENSLENKEIDSDLNENKKDDLNYTENISEKDHLDSNNASKNEENRDITEKNLDNKDDKNGSKIEKSKLLTEKIGEIVANSLNLPLSNSKLVLKNKKNIENIQNNLKSDKNISKNQLKQQNSINSNLTSDEKSQILDIVESNVLKSFKTNDSAGLKKGLNSLAESFRKNIGNLDEKNINIESKTIDNHLNFADIAQKTVLNIKNVKELSKKSTSEKIDFNSSNFLNNSNINSLKNNQAIPLNSKTISKAVINQIEEHIQFMKTQGKQRVILQLQPEHLGSIEIKVTKTEKEMKIAFKSDNVDTLQILEQNRDDLKNIVSTLKEDGFYSGLDLSFSQFSNSNSGDNGKNSSFGDDNIFDESIEIESSTHQGIIEVVV
ncbi:flagellar hook-length control protein FliK [bacterium]|nr:flagellar hook-length control protein FliK [bacterium]